MTLLELKDVRRTYRSRRHIFGRPEAVHAVNGVSLVLQRGRTLGLVGESGCGKSTAGRLAAGLEAPDSGQVCYDEAPMARVGTRSWKDLRARIQLVFQDPLGALDRRLTVATQIKEPLVIHGRGSPADHEARMRVLLDAVGMRPDQAAQFPHELSGGQRQRVVIARALATNPDLLVCDEPVSALDVSIQAQVVNLLADLQEEFGLAMLFISHDLKLVGCLADEVAVMYLGQIVEQGEPHKLYAQPAHPYTRALLAAVPDPARRGPRPVLSGEPPNPAARPSGCAFHPRCPVAMPICKSKSPALLPGADGRVVACHLAHDPALSAKAGST
jgi:peptide/nickel transport system ATP-binding protein